MAKRNATEIAIMVSQNMPSIGFASRDKRIAAFNQACAMIQQLASDEDDHVDEELAVSAFEILTLINKRFRKALDMTAINFDRIPMMVLNELAYGMALSVREQVYYRRSHRDKKLNSTPSLAPPPKPAPYPKWPEWYNSFKVAASNVNPKMLEIIPLEDPSLFKDWFRSKADPSEMGEKYASEYRSAG